MDWSKFHRSDLMERGESVSPLYAYLGLSDTPVGTIKRVAKALMEQPFTQVSEPDPWAASQVTPMSVDAGILNIAPDATTSGTYPPKQPSSLISILTGKPYWL